MRKREAIDNFETFLEKEFILGIVNDPQAHVPDPLQCVIRQI